jgi:hypothetical protein
MMTFLRQLFLRVISCQMWRFDVTGEPEHSHLEFLGWTAWAMLTILLTMQTAVYVEHPVHPSVALI